MIKDMTEVRQDLWRKVFDDLQKPIECDITGTVFRPHTMIARDLWDDIYFTTDPIRLSVNENIMLHD